MRKTKVLVFTLVLMMAVGASLVVPATGFSECPDGIVGYWKMDDTGSPYTDFVAGNDAVTISGTPTPASTEGINGALQFTGSNSDGLNIDASSAFNWTSTESFSIELWVKTDGVTTTGATDVLIARNVGATALQWWIGVNKEINDALWHHLVFVRDGSADTNILYVDGGVAGGGEEIADPYNFTSSFSSDSEPISIGYMEPGDFYYDGYIDEVAIYGEALSPTDINTHYTTGQGAGGKSVTALRPAPTANAGPDQNVNENVLVTLAGSGTTYSGASIMGYQWTQTAGTTTVSLSAATAAAPTFTAPAVAPGGETYTFSLTVTASDGQISTADTVDIVVADTTAPTANAGPDQSVTEGDTVTLDGRGSSPAVTGATLTYAWTQTDATGLTATLSDATAVQPTFTAPDVTVSTTLTFQLIVTENSVSSAPATVNITVGDVTTNPDADAGPDQAVTEGATVTLDGSGSLPAAVGGTLTYSWTQTDTTGLTVTLSDTTVVSPTFTAPDVTSAGATLTFQLTVTEGTVTSTDSVDIVVNDAASTGGGGGGGGCFIGSMF
jgi:hypothetical protein